MSEIISNEKILAMQEAIGKNRSSLATAMMEDAIIRQRAEKTAKDWMNKVDEEESRISTNTWCFLFFLLGLLLGIAEPSIFNFVTEIIEIIQGTKWPV